MRKIELDPLAPAHAGATTAANPLLEADGMAGLPGWLRYLIAAYPNAKLAAETLLVVEDAFQEEVPEALLAAARRHAQHSRWFPTIAEMREQLEVVRPEHGQRWLLSPVEFYRRVLRRRWLVCARCGEPTPVVGDGCPFCADMRAGEWEHAEIDEAVREEGEMVAEGVVAG